MKRKNLKLNSDKEVFMLIGLLLGLFFLKVAILFVVMLCVAWLFHLTLFWWSYLVIALLAFLLSLITG